MLPLKSTAVPASIPSLGSENIVYHRLSIPGPDDVHLGGAARHAGQPDDIALCDGARLQSSRQLWITGKRVKLEGWFTCWLLHSCRYLSQSTVRMFGWSTLPAWCENWKSSSRHRRAEHYLSSACSHPCSCPHSGSSPTKAAGRAPQIPGVWTNRPRWQRGVKGSRTGSQSALTPPAEHTGLRPRSPPGVRCRRLQSKSKSMCCAHLTCDSQPKLYLLTSYRR